MVTYANLSTYAEKMLVHENAVVRIRDDMPLDAAALDADVLLHAGDSTMKQGFYLALVLIVACGQTQGQFVEFPFVRASYFVAAWHQ